MESTTISDEFKETIFNIINKIEIKFIDFCITFNYQSFTFESDATVEFKLDNIIDTFLVWGVPLYRKENYYSSLIVTSLTKLVSLNPRIMSYDEYKKYEKLHLIEKFIELNDIADHFGRKIINGIITHSDYQNKRKECIKLELMNLYDKFDVSKNVVEESLDEYLVSKVMES